MCIGKQSCPHPLSYYTAGGPKGKGQITKYLLLILHPPKFLLRAISRDLIIVPVFKN